MKLTGHLIIFILILITSQQIIITNNNPEFQVNSYTTDNQKEPSVAALSPASFVIAWTSSNQDGTSRGIYAKVFSSNGSNLTSEFRVSPFTSNTQITSNIAALNSTSFVVTWASFYQDGSDYGVYAIVFSSNGSNLTSEFLVNVNKTGSQGAPSVAALNSSCFVITFTGEGGVYARVFSSNGSNLTSEFLVNENTTYSQAGSSVTALNSSSFVISWTWAIYIDSQIYARVFNSNGSALTPVFSIHDSSPIKYYSSVSALSSSSFVITWLNYVDGIIFAKMFSSNGSNLTSSFQVSNLFLGEQSMPKVSALNSNSFVITWETVSDNGVWGKVFSSNGAVIISEFQANVLMNAQYQNSVAGLDSNAFVITWISDSQDGSDFGVYARIFGKCKAGTYLNNTLGCKDCPSGEISNDGSTSCTKCPAGTYQNLLVCTNCSAGSSSAAGSTMCTPCPIGQSSSAGGLCLPGCVVDSDCSSTPTTPVCTSNTCVASNAGSTGGGCLTDSDCNAGSKCYGKKCLIVSQLERMASFWFVIGSIGFILLNITIFYFVKGFNGFTILEKTEGSGSSSTIRENFVSLIVWNDFLSIYLVNYSYISKTNRIMILLIKILFYVIFTELASTVENNNVNVALLLIPYVTLIPAYMIIKYFLFKETKRVKSGSKNKVKLYLITLGAIAIGIISIWICFYVAIQRTNDAQSSWKNYIIVALLQEAILNPIIYHFVHLTISKLVKTPDQKKQHIKIAPQDDTSRNVKQDEVTVTHMESVLNLKSTTETPSGNPIQN